MNTKQSMKGFARRSFSFLLALVMLLSLIPSAVFAVEGHTHVYLKPNSNWHQGDARFAVYYFKDANTGWTDMSDEDGDGYYEADVPSDHTIIFCRMNPATTENNWNNKWDQTSDLALPTDGSNCYTLPEEAWDNGEGTWSEYIPAEETQPTTLPSTDPSEEPKPEAVYIIAGSDTLCGTAWDPSNTANQMVKNADGLFEKVYSNVPAGSYEFKVTDGTWNNSWGSNGGNYAFTLEGESHVTVLFNEETREITLNVQEVPQAVYIIAGSDTLCGTAWDPSNPANRMVKNADGLFEKVYSNVPAGSYEFKVTDGTWNNSWGSNGGNYAFTLEGESHVTVLFNEETKEITLNVQEVPQAIYIIAGSDTLCGTAWDPSNTANQMVKNADGLFEKVYSNVPAGSYEFKVTDGTWNNSWGSNGGNYAFTLEGESHVTVLFNEETKEITLNVQEVPAEPAVNYYLFGYINGADYGCEGDSANLGEYKFVNGALTAAFTAESYVAVKTDTGLWYMTNGWLGDVTSATLYDTATLGSDANKLKVPANKELTFTLTANDDGTLTLSYAVKEEEIPSATYIVAGDSALCGSNWDAGDVNNKMTYNPETGLYEKVYASVPAGSYSVKVTDGTWTNSWGNGAQNYTFDVREACDVTITFDEGSKTVSASGTGVGKAELSFQVIRAVGNGSGNWLNGASWDVAAASNTMTETAPNVYEITYKAVVKGSYEVKFAADGAWTHNWGGTYTESGVQSDAVYNASGNILFPITTDAADVTLKLDLSSFDPETLTGGKFTITLEEAAAPEVDYTYTVHYLNSEGWEAVKAHGWTSGGDLFGGWPGTDAAANEEHEGWFDVTVTTKVSSIGILFHNGNGSQTKDASVAVPEGQAEVEAWITGTDPVSVSYTQPEDWATQAGNVVKLHFQKPETWGAGINAWVWADSGNVPGYEDYHQTWPGKAIFENTEHPGWYDLTVVTELPGFYFIFNDGGNQTADLSTGTISGDTELWIVGNDVLTKAPAAWEGIIEYTAHIHFQKNEGWGETVNAWIWDAEGAIPGYEQYNTQWPGAPIEADVINTGWYNVSVTTRKAEGFSFILNDGTSQTSDLSTGALETNTHLWVVNGAVLNQAPAGWVDPNRTVHVPGTFPGPSWDAGSNTMTYDPALGLYIYTFRNVPAANYEYKIAINGSWNENYGVGGVPGGSNIAVAVTETRDVTVYYNDRSHNSVTDVTYVFADIALKGTGIPEGTRMTDPDLTGIYSAVIALAAGTYEDIVLTYDGTDYPFAPFTLEEGKEVTFFFDPATGIYYHNGSDEKVAEELIFFDSKDSSYKAPFGAVATGEEVTFSIQTGDDAVDVKLVVKGVKSYTMERVEARAREAGIQLWTCTASFSTIGEYDYYFAISNGSDVKVYGDDDGFYGAGTVSDLNGVMPYDLVVYQAGFQTPNWMKNAVIYQIFPDRFFDGNVSNNQAQTTARGAVDYEYITNWYTLPENPEQEAMLDEATYRATGAWYGDGEWSNEIYGGDLEGITQRIGYLKALGVNVIYLNPVFSSISSHRYDACDYMTIDPILGDLGDFEELVAVAEANDMHIILDGVFNHVSDDSVYFDRYYKFLGTSNKIGAYPYWAYVYDYMAENSADQAAAETAAREFFGTEYGITDYSYTEWFLVENKPMAGAVDTIGLRAGKSVYSYEGWWGYDSMPVIKSTNGSEYQTGNWAQEIISGSGSVTQYWIAKGNDGWRLDVANEVSDETWKHFRSSVKSLNSDAVIIGEIWDDATKYLKGDMYDSVMNYLFRNAVTEFAMGKADAQNATAQLDRLRERYPEEAFYAMMNLVGSHDTTRILSYLDGIQDNRNQKDLASAFPTYAGTSQAAKEMQHLVAFLQFTYPGAPTIYYGDEIGMVGSDDPDDRRAFEWGRGQRELVEWYAKLAAIRSAYPALRTGDLTVIDTENANLMAFSRSLKNKEILVIANNAASALEYSVEGEYIDVITGEYYDGSVPGRSGVILVEKRNYKPVSINSAGLAPAYDSSYTVGTREPGHVHDYTAETRVVEPTCTEMGFTEHICACGAVQKDSFVDELGHDYEKTVVPPTCVSKGYTEYTCQRCGDHYRDHWKPANPRKHGETSLVNQKDATCTEKGYSGDLICVDCGKVVRRGKPIQRVPHVYEDGVCIHCGDVEKDGDLIGGIIERIIDLIGKLFPWF